MEEAILKLEGKLRTRDYKKPDPRIERKRDLMKKALIQEIEKKTGKKGMSDQEVMDAIVLTPQEQKKWDGFLKKVKDMEEQK